MTSSSIDRLALARRLDWRFLLADPRLGRVALVGRPDPELRAALEAFAESLVDDPNERAEVVVVHAPTAAGVRAAIERVEPGGSIVIELAGRARRGRAGQLAAASAGDVAERLRHEGFIDVGESWVWPDHATGLEIVPLDRPALIRLSLARRRSGRRAKLKARGVRLALRLGFLPAVLSAATVVGRRPDVTVPESGIPAAPLIDAYVGANRARLGLEGLGVGGTRSLLVTPRFQASAHVVGLIVPPDRERPTLVAKIHRLAGVSGTLEAEAACLRLLTERAAGATSGAPRLIVQADIGGHAAIVETALNGRPLDPREVRRDRRRAVAEVATWVRTLQGTGPDTQDAPDVRAAPNGTHADRDDRWDRLIRPALARLETVLADDPTDLDLVGRARDTLAPLESAGLPLAIEHGDLSHPNLLRLEASDGRAAGVGAIDWELGEPRGYPLVDFLFFLGYVAVASGGKGRAIDPDEHARRIGAAWYEGDRWAWVASEEYATAAGVDRALVGALLVATWVRALDRVGATGPRLREHRYHAIWRAVVTRTAATRAPAAP